MAENFPVGYVAMARKKTTAGGFYSYISHGLGREIGIGAGAGVAGHPDLLRALPPG
jgi:amino acid transporter